MLKVQYIFLFDSSCHFQNKIIYIITIFFPLNELLFLRGLENPLFGQTFIVNLLDEVDSLKNKYAYIFKFAVCNCLMGLKWIIFLSGGNCCVFYFVKQIYTGLKQFEDIA